jgi:small-conductance mechanosensitive channel
MRRIRLVPPSVLTVLLLLVLGGTGGEAVEGAGLDSRPPAIAQASDGAAVSPQAATDTTAEAQTERAGTLQEVGDTARSFGLRALGAVLVLVLTFFLVKGVAFLLDTLSERNAERRLLYKRLIPIVRVVMWATALFVVMRGIFNVDAQGLLAAAAAIGVAIGFAAQDLLKNIFGGLVIIFDQSFQVGDKIEVGGTYGEVTSIGLRSTRIVTPDDNLVTVPNAQVADSQVSNANAGELNCQVATDLYLPGWVDEGRVKEIARQAAVSSSYVFLEKPIVVLVKDEYDEGHLVHLTVKAYVIDTRYEALLASDVTERARMAFREEGLLPPTTRSYVDLPAHAGSPESAAAASS